MQNWIKFYETITKPLPVALSLFLLISTSFILAAPDSRLAKLGISHTIINFRWVVGLLFIIASVWLIVTGLIWLGKCSYELCSSRRAEEQCRKRLHALTADERHILALFVIAESRTINFFSPQLGLVQGLADDGILYRPEVPLKVDPVPFNIQEWALAYLSMNKSLVAPEVSNERRWNPK